MSIWEDPKKILFTPFETASVLGIKEQTLAVWRCTKRYDLKYVKVGRRVMYKRQDILDFLDQNEGPSAHG